MFNLYNEILTEHNLHPGNKYKLEDATHHQHGINPNCGDEITISLKLNNNIIEEANFSRFWLCHLSSLHRYHD